MEIKQHVFTFDDVRNGVTLENDKYRIGAYTLNDTITKTFLSVPMPTKEEPMILLISVDGVIAGRSMKFPSRLKVDDRIITVTSGSSLYVADDYRHLALGANLFLYAQQNIKRPVISAGISSMAEPLYKKTKFVIFKIPSLWQIRNIKPILKSFGERSYRTTKLLAPIANFILKGFRYFNGFSLKRNNCQYEIKKLEEVPQWAEDIVAKDTHKYAEFHDREWMQWVIENSFFGSSYDRQSFYGVYYESKPVGFFIIVERMMSIPERNIDHVVFGSLLEWDTINKEVLNEYQIIKMALAHFSDNVDVVKVATQDSCIRRKLKKYGFLPHGNYTIAFKDVTKSLDKDYVDISNWRIRSSYADTPFY